MANSNPYATTAASHHDEFLEPIRFISFPLMTIAENILLLTETRSSKSAIVPASRLRTALHRHRLLNQLRKGRVLEDVVTRLLVTAQVRFIVSPCLRFKVNGTLLPPPRDHTTFPSYTSSSVEIHS